MENISWSRTRDLPTCSAVPQPTALPLAPGIYLEKQLLILIEFYRLDAVFIIKANYLQISTRNL